MEHLKPVDRFDQFVFVTFLYFLISLRNTTISSVPLKTFLSLNYRHLIFCYLIDLNLIRLIRNFLHTLKLAMEFIRV